MIIGKNTPGTSNVRSSPSHLQIMCLVKIVRISVLARGYDSISTREQLYVHFTYYIFGIIYY